MTQTTRVNEGQAASDDMGPPSLQWMFDRAYRGLASQDFRQCRSPSGACVYHHEGRHCAWGWVDPKGTSGNPAGTVHVLHSHGIGIAARLDKAGLRFAAELQAAHDSNISCMRDAFDMFAERWGLVVPSDASDGSPDNAGSGTSIGSDA